MSAWHHVSHREPCLICGKPDWCAVSADSVWTLCRRINTGAGICKTDKSGTEYWLYQLGGHSTNRKPALELPSQTLPERAEPAVLDQVYRALLTALPLSPTHRQALQQRGLPDGEILRRGYRTMPRDGRAALVRGLVDRFGADTCAKIPGLYVEARGTRHWWAMAGSPGLLIPVRDIDGHIVALQIRRDDPGQNSKYGWFSSPKYGGASSGAPAHVPLSTSACGDTVRVTEGPLKGDAATVLSGVLTIAVAGVTLWRQILPLLAVLQPAGVLLSFDSDWRQNPHVARAIAQATQVLVAAGYIVAVETWDTSQGKGIDDVLVAGYTPAMQSPVPWLHRARTLPEKVGGEAVTSYGGGPMMATITPTRIKYGWQVTKEDLTLTAEKPHFDRGAIRAALTVRNCTAIYYRDLTNLTSSRSRARIIESLAEKKVTLTEDLLIALDEACRQRPAPNATKTVRRDGEGDFSEKVTKLADLQERITSFLLLNDPDVLPVTLGARAAHRFGGTPVWLLLVAPPSGSKTELILALRRMPDTYFLSELTARTFASGLETHGADPSLLARLHEEVLLMKDLTTVLEMHHDERQAILAQLREIYDGRYDKTWGTGKELHWEGRLGLIAGVTPIIDKYHGVLAVLGERFVMLRVEQPDRQEMATKALDNAENETQKRQELAILVQGFMASLPATPPPVPPALRRQLVQMADFVTRCRSGVVRDGYRRELEYAPEPEMPARLAKQLFELLRGVALVCGHQEATQEDYDRIARVALDCIPASRRTVLRVVASLTTVEAEALTTAKVAQTAQYSTAAVRRALEDLQALGILHVTKGGQGVADKWQPREEWHAALDTLRKVESAVETRRKATFSEKSEEGRTHTREDERFWPDDEWPDGWDYAEPGRSHVWSGEHFFEETEVDDRPF